MILLLNMSKMKHDTFPSLYVYLKIYVKLAHLCVLAFLAKYKENLETFAYWQVIFFSSMNDTVVISML